MTLDEALGYALDGDALLFMGAGFSRGATTRRGHDFKIGNELAAHLGALSGAPKDAPLEDAAEFFQRKFGASGLIDELVKEFSAASVTNDHVTLANVPWIRVYTTNYDNVFELAAQSSGKTVQPITSDTDPFTLHIENLACVHLNGYILQLNAAALDSTFKLTETSYIAASIADSPWAVKLREDIRLAKAVFVVGYSLYDIDVRRILHANPHLRGKCFFFVGPSPNDLLIQRIDRFGTAIAEGIADIAKAIAARRVTYSGRSKGDLRLHSVAEWPESPEPRTPNDQTVFDLFELGAVDDAAVNASLLLGVKYYMERSKVASVIELLDKGTKVVAITGALGNGKTMLLRALAIRARESGYRVFCAIGSYEAAALEFERVARISGKILLIIDDYQRWMTEISAFRQVRNDQSRLVVTVRDSIHDVLFGKLEDVCGVTSVPEVSIDKMVEAEVEWFTDTLEQYGLWRSMAGKSRNERRQIIAQNYGGEIHGVLLGLLQSHDIGDRVKKVIDDVKSEPTYFNVVATVFILATLGVPVTLEKLGDLWSVELLSSARFRNHSSIKQLLDFDAWEARVRSSVVAAFVLKNFVGPEIVPIVIKLAQQLSRAARGASQYQYLLIEVTRFSSLQRILPEANFRELAIVYYEGVKSLPQLQRNSLFWLQYAIACFVGGDLGRARKYFDVAYSLAGKAYYDTYQIDNHYARFLLLEATDSDLPIERAIENFRKARAIVNGQMQKERLRYPYRTATTYQDFVDRFGKHFNEGMCKEVQVASEHVLERIRELPEHIRRQLQVRGCEDAMKYVVGRCNELALQWKRANMLPVKGAVAPSKPPPLPPRK